MYKTAAHNKQQKTSVDDTVFFGAVYLARSANLPEGLYTLFALIFCSIFFIMSKAISVSTGPIFTIFLIRSSFSDSSRDVAMATNFVSQAKHKPRAIFAIFTPYESVLGVDDRS